MQHTHLTFQGFDLRVSFYDDGEPAEICNDAGDVQHLFTHSACGEIYGRAWEVINDPNNEADFRRDMELA